jgi:hypothetical protein
LLALYFCQKKFCQKKFYPQYIHSSAFKFVLNFWHTFYCNIWKSFFNICFSYSPFQLSNRIFSQKEFRHFLMQ